MTDNTVEAITERLDEHDCDARSWINTVTPTDVRFLLSEIASLRTQLEAQAGRIRCLEVEAKAASTLHLEAVERYVMAEALMREASMYIEEPWVSRFNQVLLPPPEKEKPCHRDTDGDGNCHVHPQGCERSRPMAEKWPELTTESLDRALAHAREVEAVPPGAGRVTEGWCYSLAALKARVEELEAGIERVIVGACDHVDYATTRPGMSHLDIALALRALIGTSLAALTPKPSKEKCQVCGGKMFDFNAHYQKCESCTAPRPMRIEP